MSLLLKRVIWQLVLFLLFWFSVMTPTPYVYGIWCTLQTCLTLLVAVMTLFMMAVMSEGSSIERRHVETIKVEDLKLPWMQSWFWITSFIDFAYIYYTYINEYFYISVLLTLTFFIGLWIMSSISNFRRRVMQLRGISESQFSVDTQDI